MGTTYTYKRFPLLVFGVVILLVLAGCENKDTPALSHTDSQIISSTILQADSKDDPVPANVNDVSLSGGADIKAAGSAVRTIAATTVSIQITPPAGTTVGRASLPGLAFREGPNAASDWLRSGGPAPSTPSTAL